MARKLKSDRVLFLTTLLLVCVSVAHGVQRLGREDPYRVSVQAD